MAYRLNKGFIYKGRAAQVAVCFVDDNANNLHCCGITGSSIRIENQDGSFIEKDASTGIAWGIPDLTYMYIYPFTPEETALMKARIDGSIWLKIKFGADSMKYEMKKFITVAEDVF